MDNDLLRRRARTLASRLEPLIGQVYFSPECHAGYTALGFAPSPGQLGDVALPDGPAYFTSRGSLMGQAEGHVVAAAFGVFKPDVVAASVRHGWTLTDAPTIFATRRRGAVAQLERILATDDKEVHELADLMAHAVEPLRPEGRPLFAGLRSHWDDPADAWTRFFHLGDMLREYRGDAHVAAWTSAGLDAVEIGLSTECYIGLPTRTYIRTRAWNDDEIEAGVESLRSRGWFGTSEALTEVGLAAREEIELATDRAMLPALLALGDDTDLLCTRLAPWGDAVRAAGGYINGAGDLWPARD